MLATADRLPASNNAPSQALPLRGRRSIQVLFAVLMMVTLLVFWEPSVERIVEGQWRRGRFLYAHTLSLDVHALMGLAFLIALGSQLVLGLRNTTTRARRMHRRLGRALFFVIIPVFILTAAWVVLDRSTSIAPSLSVIFKHHRLMARVALVELLGFVAFLFARSYWAIRRGNVPAHVDSIVGAFMVASAIIVIRFLYAFIWAIWGGSPFSVMGMFFVTVLLVVLVLTLVYGLAGRLYENRHVLGSLILVTAAIALLGHSYYDLLDR